MFAQHGMHARVADRSLPCVHRGGLGWGEASEARFQLRWNGRSR
jgi:hypothetical protein